MSKKGKKKRKRKKDVRSQANIAENIYLIFKRADIGCFQSASKRAKMFLLLQTRTIIYQLKVLMSKRGCQYITCPYRPSLIIV